jgi:hypothetical protein
MANDDSSLKRRKKRKCNVRRSGFDGRQGTIWMTKVMAGRRQWTSRWCLYVFLCWCGSYLEWTYNLNHSTMLWFVALEIIRILGKSKSWVDMRGGNVVTSHPHAHPQHVKVVSHLFMCLALIWETSWMGLQPEQLHYSVVYCIWTPRIQGMIKKLSCKEKWQYIHSQFYSIWNLWKVFCVFDMAVRAILKGPTASMIKLCSGLLHVMWPNSWEVQKLGCYDRCFWGNNKSIGTSTAYKDCKISYMWLALMCDISLACAWPQSLHYAVVWPLGGNHNSKEDKKLGRQDKW